jgi:nucleoside-diphosphate-sugar epimerase
MQKTLAGALAAGVKKFLLIGTVYPYGRPQQLTVREDHPLDPQTFKGRMRKAQEDLLLAAAATGRIQASVLRLPDFYGPGVDKSFLDLVFKAAVQGGVGEMIGPIDRPHEFVFVPDVGPVVARLLREPKAFGHVWHLAAAGVTSQKAMVEEVERQIGRKLRLRVAGETMLRLLGLFKPMLREMVEMHYLLTQPVLMDASALQRLIGPIEKTPYADGIAATLQSLREPARAARKPDAQGVARGRAVAH